MGSKFSSLGSKTHNLDLKILMVVKIIVLSKNAHDAQQITFMDKTKHSSFSENIHAFNDLEKYPN
jgi:hypothetical protein